MRLQCIQITLRESSTSYGIGTGSAGTGHNGDVMVLPEEDARLLVQQGNAEPASPSRLQWHKDTFIDSQGVVHGLYVERPIYDKLRRRETRQRRIARILELAKQGWVVALNAIVFVANVLLLLINLLSLLREIQ